MRGWEREIGREDGGRGTGIQGRGEVRGGGMGGVSGAGRGMVFV